MVTAKYDHWRKIIDVDGTEGWIHKNMLSKDRYVIVTGKNACLYAKTDTRSDCIADVRQNTILRLIAISSPWCLVKIKYNGSTYKGWLHNNDIFGLLPSETAF